MQMAHALEALEDAVATAHHHDAITGTAKQAVANDYNRRLAAGKALLQPHVANILRGAIFSGAGDIRTNGATAGELLRAEGHSARGHAQHTVSAPPLPGSAGDVATQAGGAVATGSVSGTVATGARQRQGSPRSNQPYQMCFGGENDTCARQCAALNAEQQQAQTMAAGVNGGYGGGGAPQLFHCEAANVSLCSAPLQLSAGCEVMMLVAHNPVAWQRTVNVQARALFVLTVVCLFLCQRCLCRHAFSLVT